MLCLATPTMVGRREVLALRLVGCREVLSDLLRNAVIAAWSMRRSLHETSLSGGLGWHQRLRRTLSVPVTVIVDTAKVALTEQKIVGADAVLIRIGLTVNASERVAPTATFDRL